MLMTAQQAREAMVDYHNYYNEPEFYIDRQIVASAYNGKSEYIYDDTLPLYLKDILEGRGYTVIEEWWGEENGWMTRIKWADGVII